jgi:hypothetical protein
VVCPGPDLLGAGVGVGVVRRGGADVGAAERRADVDRRVALLSNPGLLQVDGAALLRVDLADVAETFALRYLEPAEGGEVEESPDVEAFDASAIGEVSAVDVLVIVNEDA